SSGWWAVVALRWVQGVVFQTLGKSSAELYYTAIRPRERRWIKPAIDILVERWSDALVGVLLVVALHVLHVRMTVVAILTGATAVGWLAVLFLLNRYYGKAFESALRSHWIDPDSVADWLRTPSARRALLAALRGSDERRTVLALQLSGRAGGAAGARGVPEGARALSLLPGPASAERMRALLLRPNVDVQRAALVAAARRPNPALLDVLLPMLLNPELSHEARGALAALRDAAVPELARLLER